MKTTCEPLAAKADAEWACHTPPLSSANVPRAGTPGSKVTVPGETGTMTVLPSSTTKLSELLVTLMLAVSVGLMPLITCARREIYRLKRMSAQESTKLSQRIRFKTHMVYFGRLSCCRQKTKQAHPQHSCPEVWFRPVGRRTCMAAVKYSQSPFLMGVAKKSPMSIDAAVGALLKQSAAAEVCFALVCRSHSRGRRFCVRPDNGR